MQSHARIEAEALADGRTRLTHLSGNGALTVRPTSIHGRTRVHLVAGAFGPLGGDELALEIAVGPGAVLEVTGVAATVVLPSRDAQPSRMDVLVTVADAGQLTLAMPPIIVAAGAGHTVDVRLTLGTGAGLVLREETIRGRTNEQGGRARLVTWLDVDGSPVLRQDVELSGDIGAPWRPRAVGSLLIVGEIVGEKALQPLPAGTRAAWLALPRDAGHLLTAVADDPLALSQLLDCQLPR